MCGITGVLAPDGASYIDAMTDSLAHRGPDGRGTWCEDGIALGARRLAIVDVSGGQQPMVSENHVLVANGEIYNHQELRAELEAQGDRFTTRCDVEVILHGIRRHGVSFLERLRGFFAFALWDSTTKTLLLARDRFGIAPLVWTQVGECFAFGSEVKALEEVPGWSPRLNVSAFNDYLTHRYALGPQTFFSEVEQLRAGSWLRVGPGGEVVQESWYSYPPTSDGRVSSTDALERVEAALEQAIHRRRQGEVPVGLYLSGGLDSSLIAAISAAQGEGLPAFSHGFDPRHDETTEADFVADHLGTSCTKAHISADDLDALPRIVRAMEQPVANSDVVGLWCLARKASQDVKAVLCGEGADELFGSYPHQQLLATLERVPSIAVRGSSRLVGKVPSWLLNRLSSYPGAGSDSAVKERLARVLKQKTLASRYRALVCLFSEDERRRFVPPVVLSPELTQRTALINGLDRGGSHPLDRLIRMKFESWLPDYHLGRENRIAMAHGLEARYPFLDVDLVHAIAPLQVVLKSGGLPPREKKILRTIAGSHLPKRIALRPKGPVRVPLALFGERFHAMLGDLLVGPSARSTNLLVQAEVESLIGRVRGGSFLAGRQAFALLMFEIWLREWKVSCP
jgi:asparagine synthase (glutamine-hydrolysing)